LFRHCPHLTFYFKLHDVTPNSVVLLRLSLPGFLTSFSSFLSNIPGFSHFSLSFLLLVSRFFFRCCLPACPPENTRRRGERGKPKPTEEASTRSDNGGKTSGSESVDQVRCTSNRPTRSLLSCRSQRQDPPLLHLLLQLLLHLRLLFLLSLAITGVGIWVSGIASLDLDRSLVNWASLGSPTCCSNSRTPSGFQKKTSSPLKKNLVFSILCGAVTLSLMLCLFEPSVLPAPPAPPPVLPAPAPPASLLFSSVLVRLVLFFPF